MSRRVVLALVALALGCEMAPSPAAAQVGLPGGRRARSRAATRFAPFADLERGRWGLSTTVQFGAANSALSLVDALALKVLVDNDSLLFSDAINAVGLIAPGDGLEIAADVASRVFLGGPLGSRLAIGFSGGARAYSSTLLDSNLIALLRDGTAAHPEVRFGATSSDGIVVGEAGAHVTLRLSGGPRYTGGITLGAGARLLRPAYLVRAGTAVGSVLAVSADSFIANVDIEAFQSAEALPSGGDAVALDAFLGWESRHHALEVSVGQGVTLRVPGNERRTASFRVRTATLEEVSDSIDAVQFEVRDTVEALVRLPAMMRARALLFWDKLLSAELGVAVATGGPFEHPPIYDAGLTLRLIPLIPVTAGVQLASGSLPGYFVRSGIVTTHFQLEVGGSGLGAVGDRARGAEGVVRLGVFF